MKKFLISSLFLWSTLTQAGLPPTTSKVSGDSSNITTFNYQFPNFTGTHTGTTVSLGVNSIAGGGTGAATKSAAFDALSPMTTAGDIIVGGASGTGTRLAAGSTSGHVLTSNGSGVAPSWQAIPAFTTPTVQKFTSGSGTYTTPANVKWIRVRMVGGGGGGAGSGTGGASAGVGGGATTFGTTLLVANGGSASLANASALAGAGGTASLGTGPIGFAVSGSSGSYSTLQAVATTQFTGGYGGSSFFGGGASAKMGNADQAATNSGSGGGGGSTGGAANTYTGGGGGAGGYVDAIISSPLSSYSYTVGTGGGGGGAGASGFSGGAGAAGIIIVEEHY